MYVLNLRGKRKLRIMYKRRILYREAVACSFNQNFNINQMSKSLNTEKASKGYRLVYISNTQDINFQKACINEGIYLV